MLELIQNWAHSTQGKPELAYLGQTYANLKATNYIFPTSATTASAMVDTASVILVFYTQLLNINQLLGT
jgi:hypothetical protein